MVKAFPPGREVVSSVEKSILFCSSTVDNFVPVEMLQLAE